MKIFAHLKKELFQILVTKNWKLEQGDQELETWAMD